MATTLAACELSGYSKSNHTFLWFSLSGSGFSSSLIKPSSSLCVLSKSNSNFISLAFVVIFGRRNRWCVFNDWFLIDCDWLISIHTNHSSNRYENVFSKTNSRSSMWCASIKSPKNALARGILAASFSLLLFLKTKQRKSEMWKKNVLNWNTRAGVNTCARAR